MNKWHIPSLQHRIVSLLWKIPALRLFILPSAPGIHRLFHCAYNFCFLRLLHAWNHIVCHFVILPSFSWQCAFKSPLFFSFDLLAYLFLSLNNISLYGWMFHSFFNPFAYQRTLWFLPICCNYVQSCCKHLCADFCVKVSVHLLWVDNKELDHMVRVCLVF